jgi:hypothetical protein
MSIHRYFSKHDMPSGKLPMSYVKYFDHFDRADIMRGIIKQNIRGFNNRFSAENRFHTFDKLNYSNCRNQLAQITMAFKRIGDDADEVNHVRQTINEQTHRIRTSFDWQSIISDRYDINLVTCNDCSSLEFEDEALSVYDGDNLVCRNCADDYYFHESSGQYVNNDDDNYCDDEDEDNSIIGDYHSSKNSDILGHIPSLFDFHKEPIYLGLELEMEIDRSVNREDRAQILLDAIGNFGEHKYLVLENDSSLDRGFEMITGYTGLDVHREQLAFFKNGFKHAKSHDTSTCGLHIHICKSTMSVLHAAKMVFFINEPQNHNLIYSLARREESSYAMLKNKKENRDWLKYQHSYKSKRDKLAHINEDRYEALNFHNRKTIEFRLFKGTLKYDTIMACLEFTYATWFFTRDASIGDLSIEKFIEHISKPENRANTGFLRAYLQSKGFRIPKLALVKKNPRIGSSSVEPVLQAA